MGSELGIRDRYKKARAGEIPAFTGISSPYEAPEKPDIQIDTSQYTVEEAVDLLIKKMQEHGIG